MKAKYIRISFPNVQDLLHVRKYLLDLVEKNSKKVQVEAYEYEDFHESNLSSDEEDDDPLKSNVPRVSSAFAGGTSHMALLDSIVDIREYDVSYHIRTAIDQGMCAHAHHTNTRRADSSLIHTFCTCSPANTRFMCLSIIVSV